MNQEMPAFEEIASSFAPLIKSQIRKLHIYRDFDSFYQTGLIGLWEAYKRFDPEKGSFATFALHNVRGMLLTHLRNEQRYKEKNTFFDEELGDGEILDNPLASEHVYLYCAGLSKKQMIWVNEAIINERTPTDIAERYNVTIEVVKAWRRHALKKIRKNLGSV